MGAISREEAAHHPKKNIITRALGVDASVESDYFECPLHKGDGILLCSDGLSNMVEDREIFRVLEEPLTVQGKVEKLIRTANDNGGRDNIAVIVVEPGNDEVK